ncbi:MAG TPA: hypothetical protein DD670_05790 [Planctomycetaceae bacterium]|nr:hypothetical protein [Planctomycetaceae bacterium]
MRKTASVMPSELARAAFELFAQRGFASVTIDEIAAAAGVTKGSFYSHYASKHEIILAACQHYYRTYHEQVQAEIAPLRDPLERLHRVLELSVRRCVLDKRNRVFTTEIFALGLQRDDVQRGWAQFYDAVREMYVGLTLAASEAGQLQISDVRRAVDLMLAAIEGVKMRAAFEPHMAAADEQRPIVADLLRILGHEPLLLHTCLPSFDP